jgi:uncharacterized BrkB/YihY/UPF0761 family membrane protein
MPNAAHIHLILVHSAPTLLWIGLFLFLLSYFAPHERVIRLATLIVILMAVVGLVAGANSGEAATDLIHAETGIVEEVVHQHEEAGELLFPFALATAFLVFIWFTLARKTEPNVRGWAWWAGVFFIAGTALLSTYTSNLGGLIRHPEVEKGWTPTQTETSDMPVVNEDTRMQQREEAGER